MSLFRTLQNSPATISIFHNGRVPLSSTLYNVLEKADAQLNQGKKQFFQIDLMANKMPTYSQYQSFLSNFISDSKSSTILNNCYPFLHDQRAPVETNKSVTFKGVEPTKIFSEGEYQLIFETFNRSIEQQDHPDSKVHGQELEQPDHIFKAPLVVDWDQNLIAGDEPSLLKLLQKYRQERT